MTRHVVIAVDTSDVSAKAVEWAASRVLAEDDKAILLHVEPGPESEPGVSLYPEASVPPGLMQAFKKKRREESEALLQKLKSACEKKEIETQVEIVEGEPRTAIMDAVTRHDARLLVVGSRGLNPLQRLLLGSVSRYCIQNAPCPVVVFRENAAQL